MLLLLALLGVIVGSYGTVIGAGGGFLLTPLLLILYPNRPHEVITAVSLCCVALNAISGSLAYTRQKRVDYRVAVTFAATEIPGAVVGALTTELLPRSLFEAAFAVILLAVAAGLLVRPRAPVLVGATGRSSYRLHTDAHGDTYYYSFIVMRGALLGLAIGYLSATFGVGGGFIYVPAMVLWMRFPAYIATATSTFALIFASSAAAAVHLASGHYSSMVPETLSLAVGVVIGAQIGALVSARLAGQQAMVLKLLSAALVVVGARLLIGALF